MKRSVSANVPFVPSTKPLIVVVVPAAYFVEVFLRDFVEEISKPLTQDDKKLENSVVFIAHMLNFHVSL